MSRKSNRKPPQPKKGTDERPLLMWIWYAVLQIDCHEIWRDSVLQIKAIIKQDLERFGRTDPLGREGGTEPWYTDVVLGLYELLTRQYLGKDLQETIWKILGHCSGHNFGKFVRLTNSRHNPNSESLLIARAALYDLARNGRTRWLNTVGHDWQRGAKWRINELILSGQFPAMLVE